MGNCLPFSKYVEPSMKLKSSENNSNSQVESSVQDHSKVNSVKSDSDSMKFNSKLEQSFDSSSKEEIFFDSNDQACLESDAEDFQSVASDSAPMDIGTTLPIENNSRKNSQSDVLLNTECSSTDAKKQLIDLFRDSFPNDVNEDKNSKEHTTTTMESTVSHLSPKCRVTTTSKQSNRLKSKSPLMNCCLPNLVRNLSSSSSEKKSSSSSEKKKKK